MKKSQLGYLGNMDGLFTGLIILGAIIGIIVAYAVPWAWSMLKPLIHMVTAP